MNRKFFLLFACVVAAALLVPIAVQACAVCLTGISGDDPVADAFNWSVLFLMATPYTVVGSVGGWLFYTHRRAARKRGGVMEKAPVLNLVLISKESGR